MSLVENLVNQITTNGLSGITKPQGFDLNDDTFENLLQKNMNNVSLSPKLNSLGTLGVPTGLIIEPFDSTSPVQSVNNDIKSQNATEIDPIQIKDVDIGNDYFSNLLKSSPKEHKTIMNLAQRKATGAYNIFSKNLVEDISDLAQDALAEK